MSPRPENPITAIDPRPAPGSVDYTLLRFEVRNNTLSTVTLDSLRLANATAGPGAQADLDGEIDGLHVYVDDGNGRVARLLMNLTLIK